VPPEPNTDKIGPCGFPEDMKFLPKVAITRTKTRKRKGKNLKTKKRRLDYKELILPFENEKIKIEIL
jgi:hypothetical protein